MDGTGVPVVKKETLERSGKNEGQPAHTREAKLGYVFTQTGWDPEGYECGFDPEQFAELPDRYCGDAIGPKSRVSGTR